MTHPLFKSFSMLSILALIASPDALAAKPAAASVTLGDWPTVTQRKGNWAVVEGKGVDKFLPLMPLLCFEAINGKPGLQLFEASVLSVSGSAAAIAVPENEAGRIVVGALCEPRFLAEARAYRATLPKLAMPEAGKPVENAPPVEALKVRVRHRPPGIAQYGKPVWLEAVLEGPADKLLVYWRMGDSGSYGEQLMAAKSDGLHTVSLVLLQSDPPPRIIQYYLIAQGATQRHAVFGDPAEPHTVQLDAVPEVREEQLVAHGPIERATHRKPLEVLAEINKRFTRPMVYYRSRGSGTYLAVPMQPAGPEQWRAEIPPRDVVAPGLAYYIAVMDERGIVREGFASARAPQSVHVVQPQILSSESNRNRVSFGFERADHGSPGDRYQHFDASLERLFYGFLVARLSAAVWDGESQVLDVTAIARGTGAPAALVTQPMKLYLGRAGLDINIGDYVGLSADLDMGSFKGGAGLGYRASARIGDEHVASIELAIEQLWNIDKSNQEFDIKKGTLRIPFGDNWRIVASAAQEKILTDAPKAIRLNVGAEVDVGSHLALVLAGGAAGRRDAIGLSVNTGFALRF